MQKNDPGTAHGRLPERIADEMRRHLAEPLPPGLYLVATPIGNLGDITLRALSVLSRAGIVYCEDTRHSAKLLQHFAIHAETRPLHDHNEESALARIVEDLERGARIALISDAGTPLVSDPGFKLVRACAGRGISVVSIPGPSAVTAAIAASGLPTDAFFFAGFLPPKRAARLTRLNELKTIPGTLVFYEAPQRLFESLTDMAAALAGRPAAVARELTKLHEDIVRGSLPELARRYEGQDTKGEIVILCGPAPVSEVGDEEIAARLEVALQSMRLKEAAATIADALGVQKSRVYDLGLKAKRETS